MHLDYNPILATDVYKFVHQFAYPKNVIGMHSYCEARTKGKDMIVPFGMQLFLRKHLMKRITMYDVVEAKDFTEKMNIPFDTACWEHIVKNCDGYLPVTIRSVPEGLPVPSGNVIYTIECTDPKVFWLSSYLETALQRAIWYPTTVASMDYDIKKELISRYEHSGGDLAMIPFALHDFGARGVTCAEQAEIGGAAHLVNFAGSDNVEGIRAANFYYDCVMAGASVPATEHSVECSFGGDDEGELTYLTHMIDTFAKPGGVVSIVLDGYDVYRAAETLCTRLKDKIINSGAKIVFRPDSGDMHVVVPRLLRLQDSAFGHTINSAGFKKINNVGIIQGDGVDHLAIRSLLGRLAVDGYAADNVIFGSGGALLQKVNRDSLKFAQKCSAIKVLTTTGSEWRGISKDPVTDPGKRSKGGRLTLLRSKLTGEYLTAQITDEGFSNEFIDMMTEVYVNGELKNQTDMVTVRKNTGLN